MRVNDVFVNGIGVYRPETMRVESAVEQGLFPADEVAPRGLTGAAVAGDLPAPDMAVRAAADALKHSGLTAGDLAALFYACVWHQGPDGWDPQHYLQRELIGDGALTVGIREGCNGMLIGLDLAVGMLRADEAHTAAMVVASDNFGTPLIDRWSQGAGFTVLGDGASAMVLSKRAGFAQVLSSCTATFSMMEEAHRAGEELFPPGATVGRPLDFGARAEAYKQKVIAEGLGSSILVGHQQRNLQCLEQSLAEAELTAADITRVVTHNLARADVTAYLQTLGFGLERSTWEFGRGTGHIGASDYVVSLHHLLGTGQLRPGDNVLFCGFSPGITYKSTVIRILEIPSWANGPGE